MKKRIICLFCIFIFIVSFSACTLITENEAGVEVARKNLPSILELTCTFQASKSYATGFIIDEGGYVLTNAHVITDSVESYVYDAIDIKGKFHNSSQEYSLNIISYSIEKDIALLRFKRKDLALRAVEVGNSENLSYGATIFAFGNAEGNGISMTKGIISVPKRAIKEATSGEINEYIQIDAAVNNGSSGGPVFDIKGKVIGIITFKIKKSETFVEGIGFAITSKEFMNFIQSNTTIIEQLKAQEPLEESP